MNKKELSILEYLFHHKDHFCTSKEMAERFNISDRTVREYIKNLSDDVIDIGVSICAKQHYGYQLKINDCNLFNTFAAKNFNSASRKIETPKDRQDFILRQLFFEHIYVQFKTLEEQLFVSTSTLSCDFKAIAKLLKPYELSIKSRPNYGVTVKGSERNFRSFMIDYFFNTTLNESINHYVGNSIFTDEIRFEDLLNIVLSECQKEQFKLPDVVLHNIALHILLAIKRIKQGFNISQIDNDMISGNTKEIRIAKNSLDRISVEHNITFPKEEIDYIALNMIAKNNSSCLKVHNYTIEQDTVSENITDILEKFSEHFQIQNDLTIRDAIEKHIQLLKIRLKNKIELENPLHQEIVENYYEVFTLTKKLFSQSIIFSDHPVSDDEYSYLTLHLLGAIERYKNNQKLRVIVICTTGYSSAQMLKNRLEREFSEHIIVNDVISYYELNDSILSQVDFIVSSINLSNLVFKIPVIISSIFLKKEEVNEIKILIDDLMKNKTTVNIPILQFKEKSSAQEDLNIIKQIIQLENVYFITGKCEKNQLIQTMLGSMAVGESERYIRRMQTQMVQRELLSTVVFSDHIVVPHPAKAVGEFTKIGVALCPDGLYWSKDYPDIKCVFLVSPSTYSNVELKKITRAIVSLTDNFLLQERLLRCQNYSEFIHLFSQFIY